MKNLLTILLVAITLTTFAQTDTTKAKVKPVIIKYDFGTYTGNPVKKGWLFDDATYRMLYRSYTAADTMVNYYEEQAKRFETLSGTFIDLKKEYDAKAANDQTLILSQQTTIGELNNSFRTAQENNADLLKQFWKVGKLRLHKSTTITIGVVALGTGYLIGRATK